MWSAPFSDLPESIGAAPHPGALYKGTACRGHHRPIYLLSGAAEASQRVRYPSANGRDAHIPENVASTCILNENPENLIFSW